MDGAGWLQAQKARPGEGGSTIDFSALFDELDSDLDSDLGSDLGSDDSDVVKKSAADHKDVLVQGDEGEG